MSGASGLRMRPINISAAELRVPKVPDYLNKIGAHPREEMGPAYLRTCRINIVI